MFRRGAIDNEGDAMRVNPSTASRREISASRIDALLSELEYEGNRTFAIAVELRVLPKKPLGRGPRLKSGDEIEIITPAAWGGEDGCICRLRSFLPRPARGGRGSPRSFAAGGVRGDSPRVPSLAVFAAAAPHPNPLPSKSGGEGAHWKSRKESHA